jgi:hypothetical protein
MGNKKYSLREVGWLIVIAMIVGILIGQIPYVFYS